MKSQIDDQAVRATAAGAFNRKWEIATPTQRSFARAASYEDELAQRIAELASYKFNPTPPRGGGGGGKTAVNLGENVGGSGGLSGGGLTPQTAQSVKAALNPQTQTPQAAQTAQNIKQALNAQTPQPQPTLSPNLQKPNLTPQTAEALKTQNTPTQLLLKDAEGKEHLIDEGLVKAWQEEFRLANPTDDFLPQFAPKVKEILAREGVDKIHLKIGSLVKLQTRDRSEFIKHIKPTLQEPTFILKDANGVIFVKDLGDDKAIFASIAKDFNGEWVVSSNSHKRIKTLENKIKNKDAEVLYQSKEASNLLVEAFTNAPFRAELDGKIIAKSEGQSQVAELEDDLMKRFEVFEKQAQNDKVDVDSWFEAQRKQGNKDVLEYDKDLEIYRNKTAKMQSQTRNQAKEASFKEQGLQWLKQNKSFFENKTDEELIVLFKQNPEIKNAHEELDFIRKRLQEALNITPLKEFGTNYAEFYRDGTGAVKKLMAEKRGQVAGAFYREELGDITLAWGEAGTGKSDGWGLTKIVKYHPEVLDNLSELVEKSPIVKESDNRYLLDTPTHFLAIRKEFDGQKENWLLTAFEKDESIARRRTDLPSSQSKVEKAASTNTHSNSSKISQLSQAVLNKELELSRLLDAQDAALEAQNAARNSYGKMREEILKNTPQRQNLKPVRTRRLLKNLTRSGEKQKQTIKPLRRRLQRNMTNLRSF